MARVCLPWPGTAPGLARATTCIDVNAASGLSGKTLAPGLAGTAPVSGPAARPRGRARQLNLARKLTTVARARRTGAGGAGGAAGAAARMLPVLAAEAEARAGSAAEPEAEPDAGARGLRDKRLVGAVAMSIEVPRQPRSQKSWRPAGPASWLSMIGDAANLQCCNPQAWPRNRSFNK